MKQVFWPRPFKIFWPTIRCYSVVSLFVQKMYFSFFGPTTTRECGQFCGFVRFVRTISDHFGVQLSCQSSSKNLESFHVKNTFMQSSPFFFQFKQWLSSRNNCLLKRNFHSWNIRTFQIVRSVSTSIFQF